MIEIKQITEPESPHLALLCQWFLAWWGEREGFSAQKMECYVKHSVCIDRLPQTYLAFVDGVPAGCYQLSMADLEVRPDLYPWLINVYVDKPYRGRGVLRAMLESAATQACGLGLKQLYLFTTHEGLYEKFGWQFVEAVETFLPDAPLQRLYRILF